MHSQVMHATIWPLEYGAETFLNVAPMFHVWGLVYATWMPIYAQSTLIIIPKYEPDVVVAALGRHHVTVFAGGPAPIYLDCWTALARHYRLQSPQILFIRRRAVP